MKYFWILLLCSAVMTLQSQREIYAASVKAYESKDYKTFLQLTQKLDSLRPLHPTYTYNLASAFALNGNADKAMVALQKLVVMNNTIPFETDADFKSLQEMEGFKAILTLKVNQNTVAKTSKPVVIVSEKDLHPEGLTYLAISKTWLASSIHKRKIVAFDTLTGLCQDWLTEKNMLAVFALKADSQEKYLWVATAALPEMEHFDKSMDGKAEVLKIDIKTKQIVKRFAMEGNHVFGDLVVTQSGIVYVSDSAKPMVYKIENDLMTECVSFENEGFNLQGLALNDNQDKLFVADYLKGIAVVNLNSNSKTWLAFPGAASAKGIDGLVFYKNQLLAIQNGVIPIRVTKLTLNERQDAISSFVVLDNNRPEFDEPALVSLVGDKLYFFANSPWKAYDQNGVMDVGKVNNPGLFRLGL